VSKSLRRRRALSHAREVGVGEATGEVRGGVHGSTAGPADREAHGVLDQAALALVVAHGGGKDGQPGGIAGSPAFLPQCAGAEVEGGLVGGLLASVGLARLPEFVELAVGGVDDREVTIAGAVALDVVEGLAGAARARLS
jgi:hypothetical protein